MLLVTILSSLIYSRHIKPIEEVARTGHIDSIRFGA